jgi:hypothetical protein
LERAANGAIEVYTLLHILAYSVHEIMMTEAAITFKRDRAGLVNWLQRNQHRVSEIFLFLKAAGSLSRDGPVSLSG